MPQITVWECPHTGQLFKSRVDYRAHLRAIAKQRRDERLAAERTRLLNKEIDTIRNCTSFAQIGQWIIDHYEMLARFQPDNRGRTLSKLLSVEFASRHGSWDGFLKWGNEQGISHDSPRGKPTNWGGRLGEGFARSYPGWYGQIRLQFENSNSDWNNDYLRRAGIGVGGGGAGHGGCFTYYVTLFAEDFPGLVYGTDVKPIFRPVSPEGKLLPYGDNFVFLNMLFFYNNGKMRRDVLQYLAMFGRERNDWTPDSGPYDGWSWHLHGRERIEFKTTGASDRFREEFKDEFTLAHIIANNGLENEWRKQVIDPLTVMRAYKAGRPIIIDTAMYEIKSFYDEHDLALYILSHPDPAKILRVV